MYYNLPVLNRLNSLRVAELAVALLLCLLLCGEANAQAAGKVNALAKGQIAALLQEKAARTPAQQKMSTQLIYAERRHRLGFVNKDVPNLKVSLDFENDGRVKVDIDATVSDALLDAIRAAGGEVINSFPSDRAIRATLPVQTIELLAAREDIRFIQPAVGSMTNAGSVNSKGDVAHRSNQARSTFGATGAGIKVGVLSDSIDDGQGSFAASKASGDCPNNLIILPGQAGTGIGEGLAMIEIVHDLAPGAQLYYASGGGSTTSAAQMAKNIRDLAAAGCRVIIDDITFLNESPFQDGVIAKAVNDVSAQGVLFFSSAANSGNKNDGTSGTWEGNFVDGGDASFYDGAGSRFHLFAQGINSNKVTKKGSRTMLFWSDPLAHSANDYDLFIVDFFGNVVRSSIDTQNGTQDPIEGVDPPDVNEYVVIIKFSGAARFLHLATQRGQLEVSTSGSTRGHNASGAPNAFSVAATSAENQNTPFTGGAANPVEDFSSDGFRHIFFNANGTAVTPGNLSATGGKILQKPDITAADGVATTLPGDSGLNPFFGTSAAAPHAGAIAAQILSYQPSLTPAQVRAALKASCLNIEAAGFDRDSGSGIVMALSALQGLGPVWKIVGAGDFNGDRRSDIIWQHTAGGRLIWLLNGINLIRSVNLGAVSPAWSIAGAGNFNGDLTSDILWQHSSGGRSVWLMNGTSLLKGVNLGTVAPAWQIVDAGFFNNDGKSDILWHHTSGAGSVWLMNGTTLLNSVNLPSAGAAWKSVATGDFNGDHKSDIVWQSNSGARAIWLMNGTSLIRSVSLGTVAPAWNIVGTGQFNADGKTDILWQHNSGTGSVWFMNGTTFIGSANLP